MTASELKSAVLALDPEQKQAFILETLPPLMDEALQNPAFLMQLLPVLLGTLKERGIDLQQMMQFAALFGNSGRE